MEKIYNQIQEILESDGIVFDSNFEDASRALSIKSVANKTKSEMIQRLDDSVELLFKKTNDEEGYHYYIVYGERLKELYDSSSYFTIAENIANAKYKEYISK